jgi:glycosyltransferase involved in cell wall biosynthesis
MTVWRRPAPLIVYFNGTFMNRHNGAHARVMGLLSYLVDGGHDVILYSFADHADCPWGDAEIDAFARRYPTITLILDWRPPWLTRLTKVRKLISGMFPSLAREIASLSIPFATPNFRRLRRALPGAIFIVNYANGLLELNGADPDRTIIETHDLDFVQFATRFGHAITSRRIGAKFRSEFGLLGSAAALIAIAPVETGLFRLGLPGKRVFYVPRYGGEASERMAQPSSPHRYDILFVGSENPFNVQGILDFVSRHGGFLSTRTLAVAGRVSLDAKVAAALACTNGISLLGFVDDLAALYAQARIVVSPVGGTGLKIKVIEALAAGKPVFGSQHTLDGLPPGADGCAFAICEDAMAALLGDPAALVAAEEAARRYARGLSNAGDLGAFSSFLNEVTGR